MATIRGDCKDEAFQELTRPILIEKTFDLTVTIGGLQADQLAMNRSRQDFRILISDRGAGKLFKKTDYSQK